MRWHNAPKQGSGTVQRSDVSRRRSAVKQRPAKAKQCIARLSHGVAKQHYAEA